VPLVFLAQVVEVIIGLAVLVFFVVVFLGLLMRLPLAAKR
jgi:hypothetical protein